MNIVSIESAAATVRFTSEELLAISNALNEVCNALEQREFDTRMGITLADARALLAKIGHLYEGVVVFAVASG